MLSLTEDEVDEMENIIHFAIHILLYSIYEIALILMVFIELIKLIHVTRSTEKL